MLHCFTWSFSSMSIKNFDFRDLSQIVFQCDPFDFQSYCPFFLMQNCISIVSTARWAESRLHFPWTVILVWKCTNPITGSRDFDFWLWFIYASDGLSELGVGERELLLAKSDDLIVCRSIFRHLFLLLWFYI